MIVEDSKKMTINMDGVPTEVGCFAHTLRRELYNEHLGLPHDEVEDPLDDNLNKKLTENANVKILLSNIF